LREVVFINQIKNSGHNRRYSKVVGDFMVDDYYFEFGGKNKGKKAV